MLPIFFVRENDYVGLAILVVALEEMGHLNRHMSNPQLADWLSHIAGWDVDHIVLRQARNRLLLKLRKPEKYGSMVRNVARLKKMLENKSSIELFFPLLSM